MTSPASCWRWGCCASGPRSRPDRHAWWTGPSARRATWSGWRWGPSRAGRGRLGDALDGSLTAPERERLAAHLAACPSCRAFGRTLRATVALARQLPRAELPAPAREGLRRLVAEAKAREVRDAVRAPSARSGTGAAGSAAGADAGPART